MKDKLIDEMYETIADLHTQLAESKAETDSVGQDYQDAARRMEEAITRAAKAEAQNKRLKARGIEDMQDEIGRLREFTQKIISDQCWGYEEMDGLDVQDLAEKLGFIAAHTATAEDVDEESDYEVGDIMYKFTDMLKEKT
ncbi:hypothetical protein KAR91_57465 [Candidatus Pacearchaeota archaeon]|nr:hypothetical protein [Candidatus Pacearchaeota archaeon]